MRQRSGGIRQKLWDALRDGRVYPASDLYAKIGTTSNSIRPYIAALAALGYLDVQDIGHVNRGLHRTIRLVKNTGPRAPSWSAATDEFRDWNIDPTMSGDQLRALIRATGLSYPKWLEANGFSRGSETHLRDMMNGKRPVTDAIARAATGR